MAERRMFTRKIVDSDAFLDMPHSTQNLYFHLCMQADDDGFVNNAKRVVRTIEARDSDLKKLIQNGFVMLFDSGVIVITHWKAHNTIKLDRYTPTQYHFEFDQLVLRKNKAYTLRSADSQTENAENARAGPLDPESAGSEADPQNRVIKNKTKQFNEAEESTPYGTIMDLYNQICRSFTPVEYLTADRLKAIDICLDQFSLDDCKTVFEKAEASYFLKNHDGNWSVSFDWLMKVDNFVKTLEGRYDDKNERSKGCAEHRLGEAELEAIHKILQEEMQ